MASRFAKRAAARTGAFKRDRTRAASRILRSTLLAALVLAAAPENRLAAAPACGERAQLLERLDQQFAEKPQAIGLSADGGVLEILASSNGSWTILITYPKRPTCVVATGQGFENIGLITAGQPA